jgi:hypothetical protein
LLAMLSIMIPASRGVPRWVDVAIAALVVLALLGFGVSLVVIYLLDEYGIPPAVLTAAPSANLRRNGS